MYTDSRRSIVQPKTSAGNHLIWCQQCKETQIQTGHVDFKPEAETCHTDQQLACSKAMCVQD